MTVQSTFSYRARDAAGEIITGNMVAETAEEIGERLRADGKFLLAVEDRPLRGEVELDANEIRLNQAARKVGRDDVIAFCTQLSIMLETGVPLSEAMDAFAEQTPKREFRLVLNTLREAVYGGDRLSASLERWPRVFPPMMISLMKASEESGTMALMLGRIGDYLASERRTVRQIRGALGYPMFMMLFGLTMTVFLMAFVLPRFAKIYEQRSAALPLPTRILIGASDFITTYYYIYLPVLVIVGILLAVWHNKPSARLCRDWLRLNTPLIRTMYRQLYLTRATRTMSTLLSAGVNLLDIIEICRGVTNNAYFDRLWDEMDSSVRGGSPLADSVFRSKLIPPNVASMISSGERSGRLAEVMGRIAEFSEEELETTVKHVSGYIEPIMIIVMGMVIGGVAMALLLPVFSIGRVMTGG